MIFYEWGVTPGAEGYIGFHRASLFSVSFCSRRGSWRWHACVEHPSCSKHQKVGSCLCSSKSPPPPSKYWEPGSQLQPPSPCYGSAEALIVVMGHKASYCKLGLHCISSKRSLCNWSVLFPLIDFLINICISHKVWRCGTILGYGWLRLWLACLSAWSVLSPPPTASLLLHPILSFSESHLRGKGLMKTDSDI